MPYCPTCQKTVQDVTDDYCPNCGTRLVQQTVPNVGSNGPSIVTQASSWIGKLNPSAKIILALIILAVVIGGSVAIYASNSPTPPPTTGSGNGGGTSGTSTNPNTNNNGNTNTGAGICCFTVRVLQGTTALQNCYNVTIKIDGQPVLRNECVDYDFSVSTPCKTSLSASVVSEQGQAVEIILFLNGRQVGFNGGNSVSAAVSYSCM